MSLPPWARHGSAEDEHFTIRRMNLDYVSDRLLRTGRIRCKTFDDNRQPVLPMKSIEPACLDAVASSQAAVFAHFEPPGDDSLNGTALRAGIGNSFCFASLFLLQRILATSLALDELSCPRSEATRLRSPVRPGQPLHFAFLQHLHCAS